MVQKWAEEGLSPESGSQTLDRHNEGNDDDQFLAPDFQSSPPDRRFWRPFIREEIF